MSSLNEHYDVVIVGGAMMGSSAAWWLSREPGFDGSVLVIERDPSYEHSSTSATNSCVRQQFSNEVNIRVSQFTAEFIRTFPSWFDGADVPELATDYFGYLYLATDTAFANVLCANQQLQASGGAATRILDRDELATSFPFYNLDDIVCGSHNPRNEGYFDGGTMFDTFRNQARHNGVTYHRGVVTEIDRRDGRVAGVVLDSGDRVACDTVVNAAGPRAAQVARMAGLKLPVEPDASASPTSSKQPNHSTSHSPSPSTRRACTCAATATPTWPAAGQTSTMPSSPTISPWTPTSGRRRCGQC